MSTLTRRQLKLKQEQDNKLNKSIENEPVVELPAKKLTKPVIPITNGTGAKRGRKPSNKPLITAEDTAKNENNLSNIEKQVDIEMVAEKVDLPATTATDASPINTDSESPMNISIATTATSIAPNVLSELTTNNQEANKIDMQQQQQLQTDSNDLQKPANDEIIVQREQEIVEDVIKTGISKLKKNVEVMEDDDDDDDDDDEDDDSDDSDMDDLDEYETDPDEHNDSENKMNGSVGGNKNKSMNKEERDRLRRRLPISIKELIDYHSGNGKSIKEIVTKINQVCKSEEKVSYGYVQKYLYRKKLEATTAKKARYYRKKYGFVYRRMRRKPVLTEHHRSLRLQWCGKYEADNFDKDIFIGKTALKPFLASLNQLKGQPVDPNQPRTQTTLHLWGAISRKGASPLQIFDGSLTTAMYLEILLDNIVPFIAENFPAGHRFHQDNNPKHSAKLSQEFLSSTGINWVKSPPRSHDLNPIELVWTDLIQNVAKRLPKTIGQVVVAVKDYWKTLTPEKCSEFIDKLVEIVPKVIEKNGEWVSLS